MEGPALTATRELAAPGVPRFAAVTILPYASSQFPCRRSRISGFPLSQRTFARSVTVVPGESVEFNVARTRLAPVSPRPLATTCRHGLLPVYPPFAWR